MIMHVPWCFYFLFSVGTTGVFASAMPLFFPLFAGLNLKIRADKKDLGSPVTGVSPGLCR